MEGKAKVRIRLGLALMNLQLAWRRAHPRRMRENTEIVSFVIALIVPPTATLRDVAVRFGRIASVPSVFSRYGGV